MKEIQINQAKYTVCDDTLLYPSGSTTIRNKIEIHMKVDGLEYSEFENLLKQREYTHVVFARIWKKRNRWQSR